MLTRTPVADRYLPAQEAAAYRQFVEKYPAFLETSLLDKLRGSEYARLDQTNQIYLDYTGGGLHAASQVETHLRMLNQHVFGNPHSSNPTSLAMTKRVEQARAYVLEFFNADPAEYTAIFTPNASGALKLVGEAYPFDGDAQYALASDNHNSVNGIREFADRRGASIHYVPALFPEMRLDEGALLSILDSALNASARLFAFPGQSNFTGVKHPLKWIAYAKERGWNVLLDAAAFAPTNRLDLSRHQPDFVALSFYKIFGYPTGVGCLIAKKQALGKLRRPWFGGGTITLASVKRQAHYLAADEVGFEDGTVNYLSLPAIEIGLRHIQKIGIDTIHKRVTCLTGWLLEQLCALRHDNGAPLIEIYGPLATRDRGGTITAIFCDPDGSPYDEQKIEACANENNISIRIGCFCNPGAGEIAHRISTEEVSQFHDGPYGTSFFDLQKWLQRKSGKKVGAIRISVGLATNFADVYRFMAFASTFRNLAVDDLGGVKYCPLAPELMRDGV